MPNVSIYQATCQLYPYVSEEQTRHTEILTNQARKLRRETKRFFFSALAKRQRRFSLFLLLSDGAVPIGPTTASERSSRWWLLQLISFTHLGCRWILPRWIGERCHPIRRRVTRHWTPPRSYGLAFCSDGRRRCGEFVANGCLNGDNGNETQQKLMEFSFLSLVYLVLYLLAFLWRIDLREKKHARHGSIAFHLPRTSYVRGRDNKSCPAHPRPLGRHTSQKRRGTSQIRKSNSWISSDQRVGCGFRHRQINARG